MIWTGAFWKATAERAVSTFAQATLGVLPVSVLPQVSIPWWGALVAGGFAAVLSVLKALGASQVGSNGPSLTNSEKLS